MTALSIDDPAYFARLASVESEHWWSAALWRITDLWLNHAIAGRSSLIALDVGCGAGGTMRRLAERPEIARVVGIDPSIVALGHAADSSTLRGTAQAIPVATHSLDVVTCFDVLQHVSRGDDQIAVREIARVLKPGGVAVVRTNGAGLWPDRARLDMPYRLETLAALANTAEMAVRRATYVNCIPSVASEILGRIRPASTHLGHPQGRGLRARPIGRWKNRIMGTIATAESVLVGRFPICMPFGHSAMMLIEKPRGDNL